LHPPRAWVKVSYGCQPNWPAPAEPDPPAGIRRAAWAGAVRGTGLVNRGGPLQGVAVRWWPSARTRNLYFGHLLSSFVTFSHLVTVAAVYDRRKWVETVKKRSSSGCSIDDLCKMSRSLVKKIWRVAAELTRLKSFFGRDGALRRPLTGASGFFAGQLPAGHPEATVLNQSVRRCRWHRLRWGENGPEPTSTLRSCLGRAVTANVQGLPARKAWPSRSDFTLPKNNYSG